MTIESHRCIIVSSLGKDITKEETFMMNTRLAMAVMSSTIIYCATVLTVFLIVYSVVLSLNPTYTTNIVYLKSLGFVSLIIVADDVVKFIGYKDKWSMLGLGAFMFSLGITSMLPKSLLVNFSIIEAAGLAITPLILFASLFKYVKKATKKQLAA